LSSLETFLSEWCYPGPYRSVGTPEQTHYPQFEAIDELFRLINQGAAPVYVSVNPYNEAGEVELIDRLFFDFDCKEKVRYALDDALSFTNSLVKFYNISPLIIFSGKKGYHVYVWLEQPVEGPPNHLAALYKLLRDLLVKGRKYRTLDAQAADITRLTRVPYSKHQVTGALCVPVDPDLEPYKLYPGFSETLRENGISSKIVQVAERQLYRPRPEPHMYRGQKGKPRPCIEAVLGAKSIHDPLHLMKVAAVAELHADGVGADEIITHFSKMDGFNEDRTRYFVEHSIKRGYKPFRCTTIQKLGGCLPSCPRRRVPGPEPAGEDEEAET